MAMQTILLFDVSASMDEKYKGTTRLGVAKELGKAVIEKASRLDPDGAEVFTFGATVKSLGAVDQAKAESILNGLRATEFGTNLGAVLAKAFESARNHQANGDSTLIVVFTDGAASDPAKVQSEIINHTKQMSEDGECAVEIVYISNEAKDYLQSLDDDLESKGAKFDIVDATSIEDAQSLGIEEFFNKAFND